MLSASTTPTINWARDVNATRFVKVLIVRHSDDAELGALRTAVMSAGASIYCRYGSVLALAALLPAHQVSTIAARPDVQSISPNRRMKRATSTVDTVTGTAAVRSTGSTTFPQRLGLTGAGIGFAVLDSGFSYQHNPFKGDGDESRVREAVSFTKAGDAVRAGVRDWTAGIDVSGTLNPAVRRCRPDSARSRTASMPRKTATGTARTSRRWPPAAAPTRRSTRPAVRRTPSCGTSACSTTTATASCRTCSPASTGGSTAPGTRTSAS